MKRILTLLPAAVFLVAAGVALQYEKGWIGAALIVCAVVYFFESIDNLPTL